MTAKWFSRQISRDRHHFYIYTTQAAVSSTFMQCINHYSARELPIAIYSYDMMFDITNLPRLCAFRPFNWLNCCCYNATNSSGKEPTSAQRKSINCNWNITHTQRCTTSALPNWLTRLVKRNLKQNEIKWKLKLMKLNRTLKWLIDGPLNSTERTGMSDGRKDGHRVALHFH